jgi:23S rRNA (adenine2503-C2)-methyltransferase
VAKQIADWLYKKNISSISEMTNLSVKVRNRLEEIYEIGKLPPIKGQVSVDGTIKYLYPTYKGKFIETAFIPEKGRATLCVSSQIGCRMGCFFCMTAKQGLNGQLSAGEIINQLISLPEHNRITNIVYMGMGEPFDNIDEVMKSLEILTSTYGFGFGPKRITVSTIGVIPGIKQFLYESKCHLAVSLHSPFDEERQKLMPIQKIYPIKEVLNEIKKFNFGLQRRISFEYIMFKNLNDSPGHVKELTRILNGIRCRINLIKYHTIPGSRFEPSENESIIIFKDALNNKGIKTTLRQSRGQDIYAACGLLSTKLDYSG